MLKLNVDRYSDAAGGGEGNVTRRPHRRRADPRRTVCSSVRVLDVDVGYR